MPDLCKEIAQAIMHKLAPELEITSVRFDGKAVVKDDVFLELTDEPVSLQVTRVGQEHKQQLLHAQEGHLTFSSTCEHCIKGGGRCRRHLRSKSPAVNTLCIDVGGPFILAHGHDGSLKKHLVVFALRSANKPSQDSKDDGGTE